MTLPVLYSFRRCPYAMRARMAIAISGVHVELREVVLRDKPPEMIAASEKATVPVLVLADGRVVNESFDIMHWALAQKDPENWLACEGAETLIIATEADFKPHLDRYKYADRYPRAEAKFHLAKGLTFLADLNKRLASQPCLCGDKRGLADMAIFPFVRQFANTDRDLFDAQDLKHLQKWLASHLASPLFVSIMDKRKPWAEGDEVTLFP